MQRLPLSRRVIVWCFPYPYVIFKDRSRPWEASLPSLGVRLLSDILEPTSHKTKAQDASEGIDILWLQALKLGATGMKKKPALYRS